MVDGDVGCLGDAPSRSLRYKGTAVYLYSRRYLGSHTTSPYRESGLPKVVSPVQLKDSAGHDVMPPERENSLHLRQQFRHLLKTSYYLIPRHSYAW